MSNACYQMAMNLKALNQRNGIEKAHQMNQTLYNCPICRDTGWILKPQKNGMDIAVSCECRNKEILHRQWKASGINLENRNRTFTNFEEWNEHSKLAKEVAIAYVKDFSNIRLHRNNSLLLCGQVGSGKTHLALATALNLIDRHNLVVYMSYRDVVTDIKQNMLDAEYYKKKLAKYQRCQVLLIDDLYKGKVTESDLNIMFEIINYRYLNYLPIIISTEYAIDVLLSFDEAIGSRIYEMCKEYIVQIPKNIKNNYRLR